MTFSAANTIWVLLGAALVFFMQAGFAMCEAGFTRAKNTGNILMKNLMDFCIGTPLYWLVGYGIMFGAGTALFGWIDPFIMKDYTHILPAGVPLWAFAIDRPKRCERHRRRVPTASSCQWWNIWSETRSRPCSRHRFSTSSIPSVLSHPKQSRNHSQRVSLHPHSCLPTSR